MTAFALRGIAILTGFAWLAFPKQVGLMGCEPSEWQELQDALLSSNSPCIRRMLRSGLSEPILLGDLWRCPVCGSRQILSMCVACNSCKGSFATVDEPNLPDPPEPTNYLPGTARKIEVMRARAEAGYAVFHPDDLQ